MDHAARIAILLKHGFVEQENYHPKLAPGFRYFLSKRFYLALIPPITTESGFVILPASISFFHRPSNRLWNGAKRFWGI